MTDIFKNSLKALQKEILSTGDGYYVEPDQPHGCVCLEAGVLIDTFSPMRADFLI